VNDKLLYRVPEAAARLSLSRAKVYELIKLGVLKSVRIDGARRVRHEDLRAYVESLSEAA
jgi:excisionase family DNA binding protein